VAVAGEGIVAVCEDNTVNVYDAVTGVPKLSLNPPQQVTKVEGSPDGSILFLAHQRVREITVWDTQTGGLAHTLTTMSDISDIAASSKGKHLGSCSSNGTFEFWEVKNWCGGSRSLDQAVVSICWLEPEDQVALALGWSVVILEVTTGRKLHTCVVGGSLRRIAFSACKHMLAFWFVHQEAEGQVGTINIRSDFSLAWSNALRDISSITFSDDGHRVVCTTNGGDLLSYDLTSSSRADHHLSHLGTIHSVNLLRGGHLVVSSGESIQLVGPEYTQMSGASQDPGIAHVYQLDDSKVICGLSKDHRDVSLLDMETMKILGTHRVDFDQFDPSFAPRFLCASINEDIAILRLRTPDGFALRRCKIGSLSPVWEELSSRPVLLGSLSPDGHYLVTVSGDEDLDGNGDWELCFRSVLDGDVVNDNDVPFIRKGTPPSKIAFTSQSQFYTEERRVFSTPPRDEDQPSDYEDHHAQTTSTPSITSNHPPLHPWPIPRTAMSEQTELRHIDSGVREFVTQRLDETPFSTTDSEGQSHAGVHHKEYRVRKTFFLYTFPEEEPGEEILPVLHPYSLDKNLEWVVDAGSRRVCWLPPGYVTGVENGHFFSSSSLITAGQDGIVRKLTFREPRAGCITNTNIM